MRMLGTFGMYSFTMLLKVYVPVVENDPPQGRFNTFCKGFFMGYIQEQICQLCCGIDKYSSTKFVQIMTDVNEALLRGGGGGVEYWNNFETFQTPFQNLYVIFSYDDTCIGNDSGHGAIGIMPLGIVVSERIVVCA